MYTRFKGNQLYEDVKIYFRIPFTIYWIAGINFESYTEKSKRLLCIAYKGFDGNGYFWRVIR